MKERSERTAITADRVLRELARVAFLDIGKALDESGNMKPIDEMDEDTRRAIAGIEITTIRDGGGKQIGAVTKIKLSDKLRALEIIGRHLGMLDQKLTLAGEMENPLTLPIKSISGSSFNPVIIDGGKGLNL